MYFDHKNSLSSRPRPLPKTLQEKKPPKNSSIPFKELQNIPDTLISLSSNKQTTAPFNKRSSTPTLNNEKDKKPSSIQRKVISKLPKPNPRTQVIQRINKAKDNVPIGRSNSVRLVNGKLAVLPGSSNQTKPRVPISNLPKNVNNAKAKLQTIQMNEKTCEKRHEIIKENSKISLNKHRELINLENAEVIQEGKIGEDSEEIEVSKESREIEVGGASSQGKPLHSNEPEFENKDNILETNTSFHQNQDIYCIYIKSSSPVKVEKHIDFSSIESEAFGNDPIDAREKNDETEQTIRFNIFSQDSKIEEEVTEETPVLNFQKPYDLVLPDNSSSNTTKKTLTKGEATIPKYKLGKSKKKISKKTLFLKKLLERKKNKTTLPKKSQQNMSLQTPLNDHSFQTQVKGENNEDENLYRTEEKTICGVSNNNLAHSIASTTEILKKSLITSSDMQTSLQNSIQAVRESFDQTRKNFLALFQPHLVRLGHQESSQKAPDTEEKSESTNNSLHLGDIKEISLKKLFQNRLSSHKKEHKSKGKASNLSHSEHIETNSHPFSSNSKLCSESTDEKTLTSHNMSLISENIAEIQEETAPVVNNLEAKFLEARRNGQILSEDDEVDEKLSTLNTIKLHIRGWEETAPETDCIMKILSKQSCIYRYNDLKKKTHLYQACSLVTKGTVIYVHSSLKYLTELVQCLPASLSGACINSLLTKEKVSEILQLLRSEEVKILFITPEKLASEEIIQALPTLDIAFLCLDEAHCIPELSPNSKMSHYNTYKSLRNQLRRYTILALVPPCTYQICQQLASMIFVPSSNIFPVEYDNILRSEITISRDEDKLKTLLSFLKSPRYKSMKNSLLIFTDCRKSVDEVSSCLLQNGYKAFSYHNGKTEIQKLETLNNFTRIKGSILVSISTCELGIARGQIGCIIHYTMPRSIESYIQEISFLNEGTLCHMFLHEEDYYRMRLSILNESVEKEQVDSFLYKILEEPLHTKDTLNLKGRNGAVSSGFEAGIEALLDGLVKKKDHHHIGHINNKDKMQEEDQETKKELVKDTCEVLHCVQIAEICQELDLKRELIVQIFEKLEENSRWLEYYGVIPVNCVLRFANEEDETLFDDYPVIKSIIDHSKKGNGSYKFNIVDLANRIEFTVPEIFYTLKQLKQERLVNYETSDESFCYKINFKPNPWQVKAEVQTVQEKFSKKSSINFQKLDLMYIIAKSFSFQTIEYLYKQATKVEHTKRFKNTPLQIRESSLLRKNSLGMIKASQSSLQISSNINNISNEKDVSVNKKNKANIAAIFERYFNLKEGLDQGFDRLWEGTCNIQNELPLYTIHTQREKSSLMNDIQPLISILYEELVSKDQDGNKLPLHLSKKTVRIIQGLIPQLNNPKNNKLPVKNNNDVLLQNFTKLAEKYYKHDTQDLYYAVAEIVNNFLQRNS